MAAASDSRPAGKTINAVFIDALLLLGRVSCKRLESALSDFQIDGTILSFSTN